MGGQLPDQAWAEGWVGGCVKPVWNDPTYNIYIYIPSFKHRCVVYRPFAVTGTRRAPEKTINIM